jgi:hypothetical protein
MNIALWVGVTLAVVVLIKIGIVYVIRRVLSESDES